MDDINNLIEKEIMRGKIEACITYQKSLCDDNLDNLVEDVENMLRVIGFTQTDILYWIPQYFAGVYYDKND
jgi:hypothetical protein